jgi:hypothetical protein
VKSVAKSALGETGAQVTSHRVPFIFMNEIDT